MDNCARQSNTCSGAIIVAVHFFVLTAAAPSATGALLLLAYTVAQRSGRGRGAIVGESNHWTVLNNVTVIVALKFIFQYDSDHQEMRGKPTLLEGVLITKHLRI